MKRKPVQKESKSLKTFYLYASLVLLAIAISFVIKLFLIFQQSKFDGRHHFTLAITRDQKVKEIISFSPQIPSLSVLNISEDTIPVATLGRSFGIAADAQLELPASYAANQDVTAMMWQSVTHYTQIKTDATIIDYLRLTFLAREIVSNNKVIRDISLTRKDPENNTIIARALNDPTLSSENVSIQIINASDTTGIGQRLGHVLTNMGANVVEVSTSHAPQPKSSIKYFENTSYTLDQIKSLLGYPVVEITNQPIANIVIILGEDSKNTSKF